MNGRSGTFSPVSTDGSEWSGISRYQGTESSFSPVISNQRGNLATPPVSTSNGIHGHMFNGMNNRRPSDAGNPSPPSSVAGRSSYGGSRVEEGRRKTLMMEESLAQHYSILKRYLAQSLRDEKGNPKPNKARDKLLRLSAVQFQELSTDVYDELLRRQNASRPPPSGPSQVPAFLLPKDNFHPKRNQARQKLATLPAARFRDLATDVFYELERRFPRFAGGDLERTVSPASSARGPSSRQGTPTGIRPGSRDPSSMRGPPGPAGGYGVRNPSLGNPYLSGPAIPEAQAQEDAYERPTAKTFQSHTIIPNKSTLVEDDDDQTGPEDNGNRRSNALAVERDTHNTSGSRVGAENDRETSTRFEGRLGELQDELKELESRVRDKDVALERLHNTNYERENVRAHIGEQNEWTNLRSELERKLNDAVKLNDNLQAELEKLRADHADTERLLEQQASQATKNVEGVDEWRTRFEDIDMAHQELQAKHRQQSTVTNEVKQEAAVFLKEMKELASQSSEAADREEKLVQHVHKLEEQIREWKSRYARTKAQARTLRASSRGMSVPQPDLTQLGSLLAQDGLVQEIHVTGFQIAIDELLRAARGSEPTSVLTHVRSVVIAVRDINQDVGNALVNDEKQGQAASNLKQKISATANNLITASKNFAISKGISPVSLLDAAASHLTTAVVDLIRIFKICPTPAVEMDDDDDDSLIAESPAYYGVSFDAERGHSFSGSSGFPPHRLVARHQTALSPASERNLPLRDNGRNMVQNSSSLKIGLGVHVQDDEIEDLKAFVENQTEGLLQSIQSLVGSIRVEDKPATVKEHLDDISVIVGKIVRESEDTMQGSKQTAVQDRTNPVVQTLIACRALLMDASVEGNGIQDGTEWKEFTKKLPPLAFDVARQTKELMQRLNAVNHEGKGDDVR